MCRSKTGIILVVGSLSLWLVEKSTHSISSFIAKLHCGDQYIQTVDGVIGDKSCGFNDDMYVASVLLILLLSGFMLHITRKPG